MDATETASEAIATNIEGLILARGVTRTHVYQTAGISRQSFERSMRGGRPFTIAEVIRMARALHVTPGDLLPSEWTHGVKDAA